MPRGDTMWSTKKIDERDRAREQATGVRVPVVVADGGEREQRDGHERQRVHDPVRQEEVLEVDHREHDERDGDHDVRRQHPRVVVLDGNRTAEHAAQDRDPQPPTARRRMLVGTGRATDRLRATGRA